MASMIRSQSAAVPGRCHSGRDDGLRQGLAGQRGQGTQLAEVRNVFQYHAIGRVFLGRKVEQDRLHPGIGEVCCNLGPHDAGTKHRDFSYK